MLSYLYAQAISGVPPAPRVPGGLDFVAGRGVVSVPMGTFAKTCHACGRPVPGTYIPRDYLSTCSPCRKAGADPRDIWKQQFFDQWIEADVVPDPDASIRTADLWGAYLSWITILGADDFYGKNRFVEKLEGLGLGREVRTNRSRWYHGVRTVTPLATDERARAESRAAEADAFFADLEASATMGSTGSEAAPDVT